MKGAGQVGRKINTPQPLGPVSEQIHMDADMETETCPFGCVPPNFKLSKRGQSEFRSRRGVRIRQVGQVHTPPSCVCLYVA